MERLSFALQQGNIADNRFRPRCAICCHKVKQHGAPGDYAGNLRLAPAEVCLRWNRRYGLYAPLRQTRHPQNRT